MRPPLALSFLSVLALPVLAQPPNVRLLTTDPADDYSPVVTPDGRSVIHVSERDGLPALFLRPLAAERAAEETPIAPDLAEDIEPTLSPNGQWLAWTSTREDAFGDIWLLDRQSRRARPFTITERGTGDSSPRFVGEGRELFLEFQTAIPGEPPQARRVRVGQWDTIETIEALTVQPPSGVMPRYEDDSNGDGRIDERDDPSIWEYDESRSAWRQLTPPLSGLNNPSRVGDRLVFSANFRNNLDVAVVERPFPVALVNTPREGLELAQTTRRDYPLKTFEIVGAARQAYLLDPADTDGQRALMLAIDVLREANRAEQALQMAGIPRQQRVGDPALAPEFQWRRAVLAIEASQRAGDIREHVDAVRRDAVTTLREFLDNAALPADLRAQVGLELAMVVSELDGPQAAFLVLQQVETLTEASAEIRASAILQRARITQSAFGTGGAEILLGLFTQFPDAPRAREQAAFDLATLASEGLELDEAIFALRALSSREADVPEVQATTGLREGELYLASGQPGAARESLQGARVRAGENTRLSALAAFRLAELEASVGNFASAIDVYESVSEGLADQFFDGQPAFLEQAREGLIREFLAKGNFELRVGDPHLAQATFAELARREPTSVEAWRGLIEAQFRTGFLDRNEMARLESVARQLRTDPIAWYKAGLAWSYAGQIPQRSFRIGIPFFRTVASNKIPKRSETLIERALSLDSAGPYFHQTRGFIFEARAREQGNSRPLFGQALNSYERALGLVNPAARPTDYARLLLNAGNASFGAGNPARAAELYQRRAEQGVPFDDPLTEFLFLRNYGQSLFLASRPAAAAEQFSDARTFLRRLAVSPILTSDVVTRLETELMDREALALFDAGQFAASAELFQSVADRNADNSLNRVRALRTRGLALHRLMLRARGEEREEARQQAVISLEQALAIVTARGLRTESVDTAGSALFGFDMTIAGTPGAGARQDITPVEEERLIRLALSRVRLEGGDVREAITELESLLADEPAVNELNITYVKTARVLTLEQLARQQQRAGDHAAAARNLLEALRDTRYDFAGSRVINRNGLSVVLSRLGELALSSEDPPFTASDLQGTWIGNGIEGDDPLRVLDACLGRALTERVPSTDLYEIDRPSWRARLLLVRALVSERLALDGFESGAASIEGVRVLVDAARADALAQQVTEIPFDPLATGDAKRLAVLAHGILLRNALRFQDAANIERHLARALEFATTSGHPEMRWWLLAQQTLVPSGNTRTSAVDAALASLSQIESLAAGLVGADVHVPLDLLAHLEDLTLADAIARDDWSGARSLAERWQLARLRLLLDGVAPPPRPGDELDRRWLARAMELREITRNAIERVRDVPYLIGLGAPLAAVQTATVAWDEHVQRGRTQDLPSAVLLSPTNLSVDNPAVAIEFGLELPRASAVVLVTNHGSAAWTGEGLRVLDSTDAFQQLATDTSIWFLQGTGPQPAIPDDILAIRTLSLETTLLSMVELRLLPSSEPVLFPTTDPEELRDAEALLLGQPLRPLGNDPFMWRPGESPMRLRTILEKTEALAQLGARIGITGLAESPRAEAARREVLAASAAQAGVATAIIDDDRWLGILFRAQDIPDVAEATLAGALGLVIDALEKGELRRSLLPARRVFALRTALERSPDEIAEAGILLAQIQGDLGNHAEAARITRLVVDQRRETGTPAELAGALRLYASYATDARQFADAIPAFEEAIALYAQLDQPAVSADMIARLGVARENAADYPGALADFRKAADQFEALGDTAQVARQWRRAGRVYLRRLNDYARAREAFDTALELAERSGDDAQRLEAYLDLARVDERVGLFNNSLEIADAVRDEARTLNLPLIEVDAMLHRANVSWLRADYRDAFTSQRAAMVMARDLGDLPFQIIGHNAAGLTLWTLNDFDRAREELASALQLSRRALLPSEEATTQNNIGLVHRSSEQWDEAQAAFSAALAIDRRDGNAWGEAYALRNIGMTHLQQGETALALQPLSDAFTIAERIGDRVNATKAQLALGDAFLSLGRTPDASSAFNAALEEARALPLPEVEWRALRGLATIALNAGRRDQARTLLDQGIQVVESLRAAIRVEELQDGFLIDKQVLYDDLISILLEDGEAVQALALSERSRGRNFIDLLGNGDLNVASITDAADLNEEHKLRARLEVARRALGTAEGTEDIAEARAALDVAQRAYTDFLVDLRARNPQLSSFVAVEPVNVAELQRLLDPGVRLVVYHVLPESVAIWVVSRESLNITRVPVRREELAARILAFRERLQSISRIEEETAILSALLIQPANAFIEGASVIGFVPHRELHLVPFSALGPTAGESLIDRFAIFHVPSASVLRFTLERRGTRERGARVLALGNPDLGKPGFDLPFAQKEAERLTWSFPEAEVITREQATKQWFIESASDYGIVHIASHGEFDPDMPLLSALQLASDDDGESGDLTMREIFALSLRADLVALSACQTGLGRVTSGDELVGLNRAFVYAGTRQILSTLWRVDDVATAVLVKHFYREQARVERAEALRLAQIEVRRRYPHPAYWAAMVMSGDWQ
jgi:CHAT domain-containing protein